MLDVMCSDFPDQYEEYRKHIREKQMKEHLKKQKELTAAANAEKNRIDLAEMAVQSALSWNIGLNKARRESRKCSLDLQTFTIHVPKKQQKVEERTGSNHYPVALIPGQYTDYYREYTPAELRYYPLNTVLYGPMRPNERKFDSQSEGSQSDSDSDSSSDDSRLLINFILNFLPTRSNSCIDNSGHFHLNWELGKFLEESSAWTDETPLD